MILWLVSNGSLREEQVELEKKNESLKVSNFTWGDYPFNARERPDIVRWMLVPGDAVFQLGMMEDFERGGTRIINSPTAVMQCDKASMYFIWKRFLHQDIEMPKSMLTKNAGKALEFASRFKKVVMKPLDEQGGMGIHIIDLLAQEGRDKICETLDGRTSFLIQEYIPSCNFELRTIIIGDMDAIQYFRYNPEGLHNLSRGSTTLSIADAPRNISRELLDKSINLARKIKQITGLDLIAVDILIDEDGRYFLNEWNPFFFFFCTRHLGLNIASKITDFLVKIANK